MCSNRPMEHVLPPTSARGAPASAAPQSPTATGPDAHGHAKIVAEGVTFDDVLLLPRASDVLPSQCDPRTRLTRRVRAGRPAASSRYPALPKE